MAWLTTAPAGITTNVTKDRSTLWRQQFWDGGTHYQARVYGLTTTTTKEYRGMDLTTAHNFAAAQHAITQNTYSVRWVAGGVTWTGNFEIEDVTTADVRRANEAGGYTVVVVSQVTTYSTNGNGTITVEV